MTLINEDIVKGKWLEIKGEVQKTWGKITGDELDKTKGDLKIIAGLVKQKHGENLQQFQKKLSQIVSKYEVKKDEAVAGVKKTLKN